MTEVVNKKNLDLDKILRTVLFNLPSLVSYVDNNLNYLYVNSKYEQWYETTHEKCYLQHVSTIIQKTEYEYLKPFLNLALKGENQSFENQVEHKTHGTRIFRINCIPDYNENKNICGLIISARDITEQKSRELELELILQTMSDGVVIQNSKGQIIEFNPAALEILGLKKEQILGRSSMDPRWKAVKEDGSIFPGEEHPAMVSLRTGEKVTDVIMGISRSNHERRWISVNATPLKGNSSLKSFSISTEQHVLCTFSDVTSITNVRLDQFKAIQNAKLVSLGEISAGIAHEINNPLAIISGSVLLLEKSIGSSEKHSAKLHVIKQALQRITKIVSGLKKFARMNNESTYKTYILADIIRESSILTEPKAIHRSTEVIYDLRTQMTIMCDELEIEQVIINIINNAIDAVSQLQEKWVKLILFEEGNEVILQIHDSGIGIPIENEYKLFQPFFTTKKVGEGTGLGLSIVKGILDQHKATITINRTFPNTCFEIRFPAYK